MLFPGGIEATANGTLIMSAVAAVIYALIVNARPTLARSAVKTMAVALLTVLAAVENGPLLLVAGLALSAIGDKAKNFQPLFITLDPARDKQPVMVEYMKSFDPRIVALRGEPLDALGGGPPRLGGAP